MKQDKCCGKYCRDAAVQRPISDSYLPAKVSKRCNRCWRKELGPESFKYQTLVGKDNKIRLEIPHEVSPRSV